MTRIVLLLRLEIRGTAYSPFKAFLQTGLFLVSARETSKHSVGKLVSLLFIGSRLGFGGYDGRGLSLSLYYMGILRARSIYFL